MKAFVGGLVIALAALLVSSVAYAVEKAPPQAGPRDVRVAKIITIDGRMIVGEILSEKGDKLKLLDLKSGKQVAVASGEVKVREDRLDPQEAIKWVGLPTYLAWRIKKETEAPPNGKIITITPTVVYVNLGTRDGIDVGDKLSVYRKGQVLKDPDTGEVLGKELAHLGDLEVTDVQDKFCKAKRTTDLDIELKTGDVVDAANARRAVAVFPLMASKKAEVQTAMLVTERLTTELAAHGVPVVERDLLDRVLVEQGLQTVPLFDAQRVAKLGRLVGAQSVLTGSVEPVKEGEVEVHARLIKVSTGEVLVAGSEQMQVEVPKKKPAAPSTRVPSPQGQANAALNAKLNTPVTLTEPYTRYQGAHADSGRISLQWAVKEVARQAGFGYDFDTSYKNTDPICRKWVYPNFRGIPFGDAIDRLLAPEGLMYNIVDGQVVLRRK